MFNLLILGLDDVYYRHGPLVAEANASHSVAIVAVMMMNALFLVGLTDRVMTKRFVVTWDTRRDCGRIRRGDGADVSAAGRTDLPRQTTLFGNASRLPLS